MIFKRSSLRQVARYFPIIIAVFASLLVYSCDKPGIVGSGLVPSNGNVVIDTIPLTNYVTSKIELYSGDRIDYSAGIYNDKLFGNVQATGLVQPSLVLPSNIDTLKPDDKIYMRFYIDSVYGDTNQTVTFDLEEASQRWRGRSWTVDSIPPASGNVITSFDVGHDDSIDVQMPQSWVSKYRSVLYSSNDASVRDSIFNIKEPGFILVPKTNGKIVSFQGQNTNLIIHDSVAVNAKTWAYSVKRTNETSVGDSLSQIYSTFSRVPSIKIDVKSDTTLTINGDTLNTKALSRVEMALYEDSTMMQNTLPANNVRPKVSNINIYYLESDQINFDVLKGPIGVAARNPKDGSFRYNLTGQINDIMLGHSNKGRFYFVPEGNSGIIYSLLLRTPQSVVRNPKLIITSVK